MKKPTKHQLDGLAFVSVRGETYLKRSDLEALLDEQEQTERDEAKPVKAEPAKDERKT